MSARIEKPATGMPTAGEADFCLLFGGLQKVRRPAGRACALKRYGAQA
jgi:hypothetical protein